MTRYYGVFASRHRLRARVIPSPPQPLAPTQLSLLFETGLPEGLREATTTPRRIGWAHLLARVFAVDVTVCSKCGGRMKILEVVTDPPPSRRSCTAPARRRDPVLLDSLGCSHKRAEASRSASRAQRSTQRLERAPSQ